MGRLGGTRLAATVAMLAGSLTGAVAASSAPAAAAYPDRGVLAYGSAPFEGAPTHTVLNAPIVGMAADPTGPGYWLVAADGGTFNYGAAKYYGSAGSVNLNGPIVGMAATPDGNGYWQVAIDGGIFDYGDARFYGSTGNVRLNQPIVAMASTPSGEGYWLVAADGGIFDFGDAHFYGSTGNVKLNSPIVGMASTKDGKGYWLVAADGGIFQFGDAHYYGSPAAKGVSDWVSGMARTPDGKGYWIANANGAVYHYGDAGFYGNNLGTPRTELIAGIAANPKGGGYWLLEPAAFPTGYTHPGGGGRIVAIASSQIGPDPDTGYFCNPYGPCEAWCALFATWVWEAAGIPIPRYPFVGDVYNWAATHTAVSGTPAPGDLVLYGTGPWNVATAVHMGVVAQVWRDGAIDTIEGDAGPGPYGAYNVQINGPFLYKDSASYNGVGIFGFAVP